MSNIVLQVENLYKQYRLGLTGAGSLRDDVGRLWAKIRGKEDPTLKIGEANNRETIEGEYVWALQDINFEVKQGEVLGIIGKNGAGKSTLLKILSKVTAPTKGNIKVRGRIASLLEVGTGFHPELTGRENIFLNGAILGMTKNDIRRKFDEIVEFSGIGKYIDTPVKRYSSGMYVRLAFAVAAHLEPEILIIDEVLAVGDAEFQKKCLGKMKDVAGEGRTVLFVSHNMGAVRGLCDRGLLMKNGKLEADGEVNKVISLYTQAINTNNSGEFIIGEAKQTERLVIEKAILRNQKGVCTQSFQIGDDLIVELHCSVRETIEKPHFWISVESQYGSLFGANSLIDGYAPESVNGNFTIKCIFKKISLLPQMFVLYAGARDKDGGNLITESKEIGCFFVTTQMSAIGYKGILVDTIAESSSPMIVDYEWC